MLPSLVFAFPIRHDRSRQFTERSRSRRVRKTRYSGEGNDLNSATAAGDCIPEIRRARSYPTLREILNYLERMAVARSIGSSCCKQRNLRRQARDVSGLAECERSAMPCTRARARLSFAARVSRNQVYVATGSRVSRLYRPIKFVSFETRPLAISRTVIITLDQHHGTLSLDRPLDYSV